VKTILAQSFDHVRVSRKDDDGQDESDQPKKCHDVPNKDDSRKVSRILIGARRSREDKDADKVGKREKADWGCQPEGAISEIEEGDDKQDK